MQWKQDRWQSGVSFGSQGSPPHSRLWRTLPGNKATQPSTSAWPLEHIPCQKSSQALFYSFPKARGCFQPVCLGSSLGETAKQPKRKRNKWEVRTARANCTAIYHKIYMDQVPHWIHYTSPRRSWFQRFSPLLTSSLPALSQSSLQICMLHVLHMWMLPGPILPLSMLSPWEISPIHSWSLQSKYISGYGLSWSSDPWFQLPTGFSHQSELKVLRNDEFIVFPLKSFSLPVFLLFFCWMAPSLLQTWKAS